MMHKAHEELRKSKETQKLIDFVRITVDKQRMVSII
jgi:hypothetical protein